LYVIDVTDPTDPQLVGERSTWGEADDVVVEGNYVYVADGHYGMQVVDITDPTDPQLAGRVDGRGPAQGVAVMDGVVYTADLYGVLVCDVSDPPNPQFVGRGETSDYASDVDVVGGYVYVADGESGLQIFPIQCDPTEGISEDRWSASPLLMQVGPNPGPGPMTIRFAAVPQNRLRVAIYTTDGRFVRSLVDGILPTDSDALLWDGRDERGRQVAAGIYHLRATGRRGAQTQQLVLIR
jgi:hypothetical protein